MDKGFPKNFTRAEMLRSNTGTRLGLDNEPSSDQIEANILKTANFLQRLRDELSREYNRPVSIKVFSCYRSPSVNQAVGGASNSAHMLGLAADIVAEGVNLNDLAHFIIDKFPEFDQVILEFNAWVHVAISNTTPRGSILTATSKNGKTVYSKGIE